MIIILDITTLNLFDSKYHVNNYYSPNLNIVSNNIKQENPPYSNILPTVN